MTATPSRDPGRQFLHSPGPSHVPLEVMQAMARQPMDMADPRLGQTIAAIEGGLRRLLQTEAADVCFVDQICSSRNKSSL